MKKNILVKLASIAAAVSLLVGGAYAAFTSSQVTITGVNVTSATPSLQVWNGSSWQTTTNLGITETHMYPGWTGTPHTFKLGNLTGGGVPFGQVIASVVDGATGSWTELKDVVKMEFKDVTSNSTVGPQTLQWWYTNSYNMLGSTLFADNTGRDFEVKFSMDPSAGDGAKGQTLNFTLGFVGQTP
ncbi:hypothetical protein COT44_01235 [Candidatus Shapirobacteria bacterium CG08_land_8_20_14_0_20_39_18]|uniref:Uncharacterized protein n=1 Tax=Candidatus Shapirobacteria bacterium CG08_land_8_20_14_0_20_39_18 TaxID=1974883 RepID=A0A2M6XDX2_9BACT|nr:MAG: hypothetical protein COT44_01235 [Candidatus Shapirobacteria bacterium CG08_land_8_20_14_0_20_39_18]